MVVLGKDRTESAGNRSQKMAITEGISSGSCLLFSSTEPVGLVEELIQKALSLNASDIHLDPSPDRWEVRFRLDGILCHQGNFPSSLGPNVVARLKVLAELLTYRTDIPQEGRLELRDFPRANPAGSATRHEEALRVIEGRLSTFPTLHGEKVAIRFFGRDASDLRLDQLGFEPETLERLQSLLSGRQGAVLLTGPGGSGKTTTLYAALESIKVAHRGGIHIFTIEDPIERPIAGITQSQARPGTEFDFARGLRSLLRQDPEVVMVGEIRDAQTAAIAMEAALTGHLLLSTVHAGSACGVLSRLLDMGVEPYALTSGIRGVLNQRLVRKTCIACSGKGCDACNKSGLAGRLLLAELIEVKGALRKAILARADLDGLLDAAKLDAIGGESGESELWAAGLRALVRGETTLAELTRVLGPKPTQLITDSITKIVNMSQHNQSEQGTGA
jgi:type II secretory ATPase GspE/PulE/Tfp pilus assembly ATPase PilB-like protein